MNFLQIPTPASGAGTPIATASLAPQKTFIISGTYVGNIYIEGSNDDGVTWFNILQSLPPGGQPQNPDITVVAQKIRVRRDGAGGSPIIFVGAENGSSPSFASFSVGQLVPGTALDTSSFGPTKTLAVPSTFTGEVIFEGTQDGNDWNVITKLTPGDQKTFINLSYSAIRARTTTTVTGTPQASIGAMDDEESDLNLATWSGVRYFFIDNENGNDANTGYIDGTANSTFTTADTDIAIKTFQRLRQLIPIKGNNRSYVVLAKTRSDFGTYVDQNGNPDSIVVNTFGYQSEIIHASSDLTWNDADKKSCGAWKDPALTGPNNDGSWTVNSITNVGTGEGATVEVASGILPADTDLIKACYLAAEDGTNTGPNELARIVKRLSDTTFRVNNDDLKIANGGAFWLVKPGIAVSSIVPTSRPSGNPNDNANDMFSRSNLHLGGFRVTDGVVIVDGDFACDFINWESDLRVKRGRIASGSATLNSAGTLVGPNVGCVFQGVETYLSHCLFDIGRPIIVAGALFGIRKPVQDSRIGENGGRVIGIFQLIGPGGSYSSFSTTVSTLFIGTFDGNAPNLDLDFDGKLLHSGVATYIGVSLNNSAGEGIELNGIAPVASFRFLHGSPSGDGVVFDPDGSSESHEGSVFFFDTPTMTPGGADIQMVNQSATFAEVASSERIDENDNKVTGQNIENKKRTSGTLGNYPVLSADPASPANGDIWIFDDGGGTREIRVRIGGATYGTAVS